MVPRLPDTPVFPVGPEVQIARSIRRWREAFYYHPDAVIGRHLPARPSVPQGRPTLARPSAPAEVRGEEGVRDD